jgi:hypothetical protein
MDWSFSRICIWESDGEVGDITCEIVDNPTVVVPSPQDLASE